MHVNPALGKGLFVPPDCMKTKPQSRVLAEETTARLGLDECKTSANEMVVPGQGKG